jgi:L-ribulose-5-phosphate 3-epimerase
MTDPTKIFGINTYAYTLRWSAADCVRHLADQGYAGVELMMYPGHLWPDLDASGRRNLRRAAEDRGVRIISLNMPNVDLNIAGASQEMRDYSLGLLSQFVRLAGELGAPGIVIGPGKANPLFASPQELLLGHFNRALDHLAPIAQAAGTRLLVENMPFGFLPDAEGIMQALADYGDDRIGVIYDVANGHFIGEDPREGLRRVRERLALVHFSDTTRSTYKHDPIGMGDVPFAGVPSVLAEIGYAEMPVLEIISPTADAALLDSARRLAALGYGAA